LGGLLPKQGSWSCPAGRLQRQTETQVVFFIWQRYSFNASACQELPSNACKGVSISRRTSEPEVGSHSAGGWQTLSLPVFVA